MKEKREGRERVRGRHAKRGRGGTWSTGREKKGKRVRLHRMWAPSPPPFQNAGNLPPAADDS